MYSPTDFSGNDDVLHDSQTETLVTKVHFRRAGTIKTLPSPWYFRQPLQSKKIWR
jgi:hypothetical protein